MKKAKREKFQKGVNNLLNIGENKSQDLQISFIRSQVLGNILRRLQTEVTELLDSHAVHY